MTRLLFTAVALLIPFSASAQMFCKDRASIVVHLATKFEEAPVAVGIAANGTALVTVWTEDGKTWTIMMTRPDGIACVMATGEAWETAKNGRAN